MSNFKTPLRIKREEYHNEIRKINLQTKKKTIRKIQQQTVRKQQKNNQFKNAIKQMERGGDKQKQMEVIENLFYNEGFIIKEKESKQLIIVMKKLFKCCQSNEKQSQVIENGKFDQIQTKCLPQSQKLLKRILYLLLYNAYQYQPEGCFHNLELIELIFHILTYSKNPDIRILVFKLINYLVLNHHNKYPLIELGLFTILSQDLFHQNSLYLQMLLSNIFNFQQLQLQDSHIHQISKTLKGYNNLYQNDQSMQRFFFFTKDFTKIITDFQANSMDYMSIVFLFISLTQKIQVKDLAATSYYLSGLSNLLRKTKNININLEDKYQLFFSGFVKIWQIHWNGQIKYKQMNNGQRISKINQMESIQKGFSQIFQYMLSHFRQRNEMKRYKEKLNERLKKQQFIEGKLYLYRVLIRGSKEGQTIKVQDVIEWFKGSIEDKNIRYQCLKLLIQLKREGLLNDDQYFSIRKLYETKIPEQDQTELEEFILYTLPPPPLDQIHSKQKQILQYQLQYEKTRKQIQDTKNKRKCSGKQKNSENGVKGSVDSD